MDEICKATGKYELKPKSLGDGYESTLILQSSDKARHASMIIKANASVGQSNEARRSTNILFKRNSFAQEETNQIDTEDKTSTAKPLIATAGRRGSTLLASGAVGGRGRGRGNRSSLVPHPSSIVSHDETVENTTLDEEVIKAFDEETVQKE
jgi:hypothetical protein